MTIHNQGASAHPTGGDDAASPSSPAFKDLDLSPALLDALRDRGYETPTPIQARAIPHLLQGRDLLGVAQTGTGKTAAFALPMLDLLSRHRTRPESCRPRALVLTPTRELASQIAESFDVYGKGLPIRTTVIFGGVGQSPQVRALRRGIDVLVATPGRLLDLMGQGHINLSRVEIFVLDEADRMLDMGFQRDVRRIVKELSTDRQSLLFSATMPADIVRLAQSLLRTPVRVEVTPPSTTVERVEQRVYFVDKAAKRALLSEVLKDSTITRTLVFTRTKHGADRVARHLEARGVRAAALHGNKSQGQRERALAAFRSGDLRALVATDIAARGLDVPGVTHVINFDLPNVPESYVHRIGRTARAGRDGVAISFCDGTERAYLRDIEREIRQTLEMIGDAPRAEAHQSRPHHAHGNRGQGSRTQGSRTQGSQGRGSQGRGSHSQGNRRQGSGGQAGRRFSRRGRVPA